MCGGDIAPSPSSSTLFQHPKGTCAPAELSFLRWLQMCLRSFLSLSLFATSSTFFAGSFCPWRCWKWKSVAAIRQGRWEYPAEKSEGINVPTICLPSPQSPVLLTNQYTQPGSKLCVFKGMNSSLPWPASPVCGHRPQRA